VYWLGIWDLFIYVLALWDGVLLGNLGLPWTHYVTNTDLKLRILPQSSDRAQFLTVDPSKSWGHSNLPSEERGLLAKPGEGDLRAAADWECLTIDWSGDAGEGHCWLNLGL
jgi:hypothetical protein